MLERIPAIIIATCLTIYWGTVVVKLIRLARKIGKDPNAIPREPVGQLMRVVWYPVVIIWITFCWLYGLNRWTGQIWLPTDVASWWPIVSFFAAFLALDATVLTFICWRKMGRSWRIGIDPNEKTELVVTGPYRYVRHPIYALSVAIGLCAIVAVPSVPVLIVAGIHVLFLQIEARREESYLIKVQGKVYEDYRQRVGRFIPRLGGR